MKVEICDLCENRVDELNCTKVIIKDYKGIDYDFGMAFPDKRKFEGIICDDCLSMLRKKNKHQKTQNKNPYPKYSYRSGLIMEDGKPVWGIDTKWSLFEIKQGRLPR